MKLLNHVNLGKKLVEINYDAHGTYNTNNQIKFKTSMLKSNLFYYSDASILVKWTIKTTGVGAGAVVDTAAR